MFEGYGSDLCESWVAAAWENDMARRETTIEALKDGMQGGYDALADATNATVVPVARRLKKLARKSISTLMKKRRGRIIQVLREPIWRVCFLRN